MKLPDKLYDVLKWITLIVIPALAGAYSRLAGPWGLPFPEKITETAVIICWLIGSIIGISTAEYRKAKNENKERENEIFEKNDIEEKDEETEE